VLGPFQPRRRAGRLAGCRRFSFRYSKRYEREQGTYVNTNHPIARHYFDTNAPVPGDKRTGSMTDFDAFNNLLAARGLSDLTRIIA